MAGQTIKRLGIILISIAIVFSLCACGTSRTESMVKNMLEEDLGASVTITKLYRNEEVQGCFVVFNTEDTEDEAAVHLDSGAIDYKSEYDYYSRKAAILRTASPIDETELHKCNQAILGSSYSEWSFAIVVMEAKGEESESSWKRLK